jgi:uncharacterized DUF497 family protein
MPLNFEWDPTKAAENARKHGVAFEEAATSFGDPLSLTIDDPDHSEAEDRFVHLGLSYRNRLVITAFTERGDRVRIISARLASQRERDQYERRFGIQ